MIQRAPASTIRSRAGRLAATIAAVLGLSMPASVALAQKVSPEAAPRAWVAYAETVNGKVTEWLRGEDEPAVRLRAYVDGLRPATNQSSPPVVLQLWIDANGVVTRVEFPPFAHEAANSDLRSLLIRRAVGAQPPRGMLLPLRLAVQLDPAPEPASSECNDRRGSQAP
jgi:hypothetical protein